MDNEALKEQLIEQFRRYLETADDETLSENGIEGEMDLYALFVELTALKNEIRIESRQVKEALDLFRGTVETLQSGHAALLAEGERHKEEALGRERELLRPLLLELLDLRERMAAGLAAVQRAPTGWSRLFGLKADLRQTLAEGQEMTLRRLDRLLEARRVRPVETLGRPLDPICMRAEEVTSRPDLPHGTVVGELRRGYLWDQEVLRPAEVIVNKRSDENHG